MYVHQSRDPRGWWSSISYQPVRNRMFAIPLPSLLPLSPLPSPPVLTALTHRPRAWRIIRVLALAGNGIPVPGIAH